VTRLISPPAIQFKGTGWYVTDYAKKSPPMSETKADGKGKDGKGEGEREKKPAAASQETTPSKEASSSSTPAAKSTTD